VSFRRLDDGKPEFPHFALIVGVILLGAGVAMLVVVDPGEPIGRRGWPGWVYTALFLTAGAVVTVRGVLGLRRR